MLQLCVDASQSVGKSSQLNRLFGTRFGFSASRCTDGIQIGVSKLEDKLILVMDCEGLFSIRRSDDEEVKLLLQITSISDINIIFCDIDGINQPLLSLFKKLQICADKMQSDSFFLGTMVLLTKNVQDEEIKNAISKIYKGGLSFGFLKSYSAKDYDSNLQKVRDQLLYKQILLKNKPKNPQFLMNILKYSMIQIYLNDDQDIDMISKQSQIKEEYIYFSDLFFEISNQKFIKNEKLFIQFEYQPISEEEKSMIRDKSAFKYDLIFKQSSQNINPQFQEQKQDEEVQSNNQIDEVKIEDEIKIYSLLDLNQCDIKLYPQQSHNNILNKKSLNWEQLEDIFLAVSGFQKVLILTIMFQMQNFFNYFIEQRRNNECFLNSGHEGMHFCNEMNHLCQKDCQMSKSCKELCTLEPHSDNINHNCQREHKCEHQCRLYDKCGKTCSLQNGHKEANHLCESTQCYDKCECCDKLCGFNLHDHDILLLNQKKNKELLMKNGKLISNHLCGGYHSCKEKCQKPGVCSITYQTEEKIWETKTSKFEYQFIKPCKSQKQCCIQIEPWQISHNGEHQCESSSTHRCDQQCPECLSYCYENYNHAGNHNSKNHRNKENCLYVSETDQIKINSEFGNVRSYLPGKSSTPENCLQSCLRMSRAHIHLRECYWNSINWEPPAEQEDLQIIQSCNTGCSHESHLNNPNYCIKQAWHEGSHQIDCKKCLHLGSGIVDICFTIDTTGSMQWAMTQVSEAVNNIVDKFQGKADIKYSIVSYRDHPPEEQSYIYKIDSQFTDKQNILSVLSKIEVHGGSDGPEAVMDGLFYTITQINWRDNSQRFVFYICDSPPHGKQFGGKSNDSLWSEKGMPLWHK
ncbi:hypothetical protein ABPG72_022103 [Tetrahymena utriculariae]